MNTTDDNAGTNKRTAKRWAGALMVAPLVAVGAASIVLTPTASANEQHTVTFQVTGAPGDDTLWAIYANYGDHTESVVKKLPWMETHTFLGQLPPKFVIDVVSDGTGATQCSIAVDGNTVAADTSPGACRYVIPAKSGTAAVPKGPAPPDLRSQASPDNAPGPLRPFAR
jgi:hypothetical protein